MAGVGQSQSRTPTPRQEQQQRETQVVQRSTWQAVLLEAGGIGAAVSEESMRRLKYCLQWLQVRSPDPNPASSSQSDMKLCTFVVCDRAHRHTDTDSQGLHRLSSAAR